ncbi:cysteine desulfurase family protein [Listeria booriae]|uniref:cysteine desulfurase n=1 Tax=Listeria booriae TaxID=1552123 RepID=A0A7X0YE13_9LIST|nr:cysteine desulfurase family protein [Listeria booriae]MBC1796527.1 cysteine desulfurase [Listeria booriae]MBC1805187.1 cysteine desulfurase [Listeria booriae]MBC1892565.1 cysteine desulfurase [Listeria booriae]MBC1982889.1 cysteine desulfurase [Listeria booriae]MBC2023604.1 cysteine desulfurase [Listeria booriae]
MERVYLDHAATSPIHPEVVQAMLASFTNNYGNPSSIHYAGREARKSLDEARATVAQSIQADEREIVFTSGGTEGDNIALIGAALANKERGTHIITTAIEHPAVLETCKYLETQGFTVTYLPVDGDGVISLADFDAALTDETVLVSVMYGNNEIGSVQPIREIGARLADHQALFHTDAVQAFGMFDMDVTHLGVDLLTVTAHKINGPRGIGFLYVKNGVNLVYPFHGGEQERKRRAGTENLPGICGLAEAVRIAQESRKQKRSDFTEYKQVFVDTFEEAGIAFEVNGKLEKSLPQVMNVRFPGVSVEQLLMNLDMEGIAVSSGSACTAGTVDPSHVLVALFGEDHDGVRESIRISFGLGNTYEEMEQVAAEIVKVVERLRK